LAKEFDDTHRIERLIHTEFDAINEWIQVDEKKVCDYITNLIEPKDWWMVDWSKN
jgi:hypothetical protein